MSDAIGSVPQVGTVPLEAGAALSHAALSSPEGILVVEVGGRILVRNPRFDAIWGLPADVIALGDEAALDAAMARVADPGRFIARVRELYSTWTSGHDEIELVDGRVLDRFGGPLLTAEGGSAYAWYFRDVTDQKRVEAELRELAETLQASLLPPVSPNIPGMDIGTRYRAGDHRVGVGGDFLDVFRLGPNSWGLGIGDVCGRGAPAASLAALARHSVRAAAVHYDMPDKVLAEVNGTLLSEPDLGERFASAVFARLELDLCGAWVTLCAAGHPRPIVVRSAGWIDMRGQPGSLLGLFEHAQLTNDRVGLGPGDSLVFCTDGVTEARILGGREQFGDERLPQVLLEVAGADAHTVAGAVLDAAITFSEDNVDDDMAVLVLTVPTDIKDDPVARIEAATGQPFSEGLIPNYPVGSPMGGLNDVHPLPPREARAVLRGEPAQVKAARDFVSSAIRSWRMAGLADGVVRELASELATNAVLHARTDFTVVVRYDGDRVRVEVGDGSRALPQRRDSIREETTGRGLMLVEALSSAWGVLETVNGKRVWFELPAEEA